MTPVDQLVLHDRDTGAVGDCLRAAVASIFDLEPAAVPHFVALGTAAGDTDDAGYGWWDELRKWLAGRGLDVWYCVADHLDRFRPATVAAGFGHVIADGVSPRGAGLWHVVVADLDGRVVHDPHPSRAGLVDVDGYYLIVRADVPLDRFVAAAETADV